jgi:hypothetical protein
MKEIDGVMATLAKGEAGLPGGWILSAEMQQLVIEAGYAPGEVIEEVVDWYERQTIPMSDAA